MTFEYIDKTIKPVLIKGIREFLISWIIDVYSLKRWRLDQLP